MQIAKQNQIVKKKQKLYVGKSTSSGQRFSTAQFLLKCFQGLHKPLGKRVYNSNSDRQLTVTMLTGVTVTNCTEQLQRQNGKKAEL